MLQNALLVCTKHQRCHNSYAMQLDLDHKIYSYIVILSLLDHVPSHFTKI